ncbi:unnamed protein product [Hymenolepis diminuta]|uniref:Flavoprotein domain-containing protein n=1 Tax=Hymenolepis diminuta TaxID=6216 RepID=A0A0R3S8W7_HYMDI|nr:unnamed protein product [Hymenolepis diminuta]
MGDECKNVLLGLTGSVASIKAEEIVSLLKQSGFNVKVIATENSLRFFDKSKLDVPVFTDRDENECWKQRNDPVLHIELKNWADIFLIAPLSANTLAKIAMGLCDNLLTCTARAWYFRSQSNKGKKIGIFAPAMNTYMWDHPLTFQHVDTLRNALNWIMIEPISKKLMCGDIGEGAMEEPHKIVDFIKKIIR